MPPRYTRRQFLKAVLGSGLPAARSTPARKQEPVSWVGSWSNAQVRRTLGWAIVIVILMMPAYAVLRLLLGLLTVMTLVK